MEELLSRADGCSAHLFEVVHVELLAKTSLGAACGDGVGASIVDVVLLVGEVNVDGDVLGSIAVRANDDGLVESVENRSILHPPVFDLGDAEVVE